MPGIFFEKSKLEGLIRDMPKKVDAVLDIAAAHIEQRAKTLVPVDTGATMNSINVWTPEEHVRYIGPHTNYAIFLELGHHAGSSYVPARPFMVPSLDQERPALIRALGQMI